ncbi:MAG: alanine racemase [Planctomycetota bacterium]|nr:alanine racemase [Planctomycetota bacterium]
MDAKHSLGEPRCLISRAAILHNLSLIRKVIRPEVKICAVVKADAYGHGADLVVDTFCNFSNSDAEPPMVEGLAVADIDEAAALPPCDLPVVVLRPVENAYLGAQRGRLEAAAQNGWILTLTSGSAADDLARIAQSRGQRASVQIMVNTGMNRAGVDLDGFTALAEKINKLPALRLIGVATHFASSEEPGNGFNAEQLTRFLAISQALCDPKRSPRPHRSAANSGGIFFHPDSHLDLVRPGISLYGIDPTCRPNIDRALRPAMRWTAPLIGIRDLPAGAAVGYGQTWTAKTDTRLGLVPVGYADGYPRALSSRGTMMLAGQPCPVAGRVSMDLTVIDLRQAPHATIGDEVTVLDSNPLSAASVYKIAELADTIPYEIFCRIGTRIRRVAVDDFAPANARSQHALGGK